MPTVPQVLGTLAEEASAVLQLPGGPTFKAVAEGYEARRRAEARDILFAELRANQKAAWQVANADALLGAIYRFERAALEGAARHNLLLLAKAIKGTYLAGDLTADRFSLFADVLASLSRNECWLLAVLQTICTSLRSRFGSTSAGVPALEMWRALQEKAVPNPYPDAQRLRTALFALTRTGLVLPTSLIDEGNVGAETSPLMADLIEIISAEELEAVGRE
jgi:hypothetical protein